MEQSKLLVTSSNAMNAFATEPNDLFRLGFQTFTGIITDINPFLSRFPAGSSLTAFRPELPLSRLFVETKYLVPCDFVGGPSQGFENICSARAR